ncbi:MAG: helix-turn-helix domain-containing protein, partial [Candidatus Sulfotelmatobacter sp.]
MGAFGEKLRQQREQRAISLDAISSVTKISTRMLSAIENERFDQLPGGVFNKGFVRAYARQVGLDEEETIADYLAALGESQIHSQTILPDFRAPAGKSITGAHATDPAADRRAEARRKETRRREDREFPPHEARPNEARPDESLDGVVPAPPLSFPHRTSAPPSSHPPHSHSEPIAPAAPTPAADST